jgi:glycosyltransferase involved in cell wall biosynthesis
MNGPGVEYGERLDRSLARPISGSTIVSVAFPFASVDEDSVGGAEQVVARLDEGIVANGGTSLVVAQAGSRVRGKLFSISAVDGDITPKQQEAVWEECRQRIESVVREHPVDMIHFHGIDFFRYLPEATLPMLATLHLPLSWYPPEIFAAARDSRLLLHGVSISQQRNFPEADCLLPPIANGVPVPWHSPFAQKSDYVLSLGRICPEKGYHVALDAANRAGVRMILAGAVFGYDVHQRYFDEQILPRLNCGCHFIGPVGREKKAALLAKARCVLIPSLVPETSSLVAMEAMACGTPVVAFANGALAEIVRDGVNGFLVKDEVEMAAAIQRAGEIPPERCWNYARCWFDSQRMVAAYVRRYESLIQQRNLQRLCIS